VDEAIAEFQAGFSDSRRQRRHTFRSWRFFIWRRGLVEEASAELQEALALEPTIMPGPVCNWQRFMDNEAKPTPRGAACAPRRREETTICTWRFFI